MWPLWGEGRSGAPGPGDRERGWGGAALHHLRESGLLPDSPPLLTLRSAGPPWLQGPPCARAGRTGVPGGECENRSLHKCCQVSGLRLCCRSRGGELSGGHGRGRGAAPSPQQMMTADVRRKAFTPRHSTAITTLQPMPRPDGLRPVCPVAPWHLLRSQERVGDGERADVGRQ